MVIKRIPFVYRILDRGFYPEVSESGSLWQTSRKKGSLGEIALFSKIPKGCLKRWSSFRLERVVVISYSL